jgi:hypothetical protein
VASITAASQSALPTTILETTLSNPLSSGSPSPPNTLSTVQSVSTENASIKGSSTPTGNSASQNRSSHIDPDVNGTLSWRGSWHGNRSQRLGLEIGLSVGAVVGVLLMLLIHMVYRCWRQHRKDRQHNTFQHNMKGDDSTHLGRASWIPTWRRGIPKGNTASSEPASQTVTSENRLSELPADDVTVVPGHLELPSDPVGTSASRMNQDNDLSQPLSPVSELSAGSHQHNFNSQITSTISPVAETFQSQPCRSTNVDLSQQGLHAAPYYTGHHDSNVLDATSENISNSGQWSFGQSPTLIELPAHEPIQPVPPVYQNEKRNYD